MEIDLILFKDGFYHLLTWRLETFLDCFDLCDKIRKNITLYNEELNKYIIKDGKFINYQFIGCKC
jgi:hypothetical protein